MPLAPLPPPPPPPPQAAAGAFTVSSPLASSASGASRGAASASAAHTAAASSASLSSLSLSSSSAAAAAKAKAAAAAVAAVAPPVAPPKTACQRASEVALGVVYTLVLSLIVVVSWLISSRGDDRALVAWCIAAFFVGLVVPLTLHDVHMHLLHFVSPLQRYYVRILFLPVIYSIESWFSLRYHHESIYIATVRDLYEPFVIHAFFSLMLGFLGSRDALARKLIMDKGAFANISLFPWGISALRPFACAPPDKGGRFWCIFWKNGWARARATRLRHRAARADAPLAPRRAAAPAPLPPARRAGETFIFRTRLGVYQYVVVKTVMTIGFFIASLMGTLGKDNECVRCVCGRRVRARAEGERARARARARARSLLAARTLGASSSRDRRRACRCAHLPALLILRHRRRSAPSPLPSLPHTRPAATRASTRTTRGSCWRRRCGPSRASCSSSRRPSSGSGRCGPSSSS